MMMITAKIDKKKILIAALIVVALIAALFIPSGNNAVTAAKAETNEDRIAFLSSFGWQVVETPVKTQEVLVPTDNNEVFERYNALQQFQGYDLSQYAGKTLKRYVYEIRNHPNTDETFYATLLVYRDEIVGGDVASTSKGGIMHSFKMPTYGVDSTTKNDN